MSVQALCEGLSYLSTCLKFSDSDKRITVILPKDPSLTSIGPTPV
jgi:hypothetical protein